MKKQILAILLVLALVLTSALALAETAKDFVVTLGGNPTTGFDWNYMVTEEGVVTVDEQFQTSAEIDTDGEPVYGAGGVYTFTVKGVKPGDVSIAFTYAQAWEPAGDDVEGLTFDLHVNDDLSVVCVGGGLVGLPPAMSSAE